jgi:hypothetical protein
LRDTPLAVENGKFTLGVIGMRRILSVRNSQPHPNESDLALFCDGYGRLCFAAQRRNQDGTRFAIQVQKEGDWSWINLNPEVQTRKDRSISQLEKTLIGPLNFGIQA